MDRRSFLGAASLASLAAGPALAQGAPKAEGQALLPDFKLPDPAGQRVRYAVVGLGTFSIGQFIPGVLNSQHSELVAFVSGNPDKAHKLGADYGVSKFYDYDNFDSIAQDDSIDVVYIALPVALHAEYAIRALKAGKHVFCEKPMASTVEECEAMIAAAKAANRQLGIAYRVHFEPNNVAAAKMIADGKIGTVRHYEGDAGFNANPAFPPHKWRLTKALAGGGSMYDIGIYALNAALMSVTDTPVSVSAVYSYPKDDPRFTEVEGGVIWRLTFASGVIAQGSSSYCYNYVTRQRTFGSAGAISLDPANDYNQVVVTVQTQFEPPAPFRAGSPNTQFANQVDAFSIAARTNTPHLTPGELGLRDIKLIQAIYRSADAGGQTVPV